jgi:hypothetical protein
MKAVAEPQRFGLRDDPIHIVREIKPRIPASKIVLTDLVVESPADGKEFYSIIAQAIRIAAATGTRPDKKTHSRASNCTARPGRTSN